VCPEFYAAVLRQAEYHRVPQSILDVGLFAVLVNKTLCCINSLVNLKLLESLSLGALAT
jgi:hypothetical protein